MNQRITDFLKNLSHQPATASVWYPSTVGSLDQALFDEDVRVLQDLEVQGYLKLSHHDPRRGGIRVELINQGRSWAAGLKP
jgi:hypothetical protein